MEKVYKLRVKLNIGEITNGRRSNSEIVDADILQLALSLHSLMS